MDVRGPFVYGLRQDISNQFDDGRFFCQFTQMRDLVGVFSFGTHLNQLEQALEILRFYEMPGLGVTGQRNRQRLLQIAVNRVSRSAMNDRIRPFPNDYLLIGKPIRRKTA